MENICCCCCGGKTNGIVLDLPRYEYFPGGVYYPCEKCGRVYGVDGKQLFIQGRVVFYDKENNRVITYS